MVLVKWEKDGGRLSMRSVEANTHAEAAEEVAGDLAVNDICGPRVIGVSMGPGFIFKAIEQRPVFVVENDLII